MSKSFHVYIMTNKYHTVLYTGVTGNLAQRIWQHKKGRGCAFTRKYRCTKLLFVEEAWDAVSAIEREKEVKGWKRNKKVELINSINPKWEDLWDLVDGTS